jgi:CheY-like chemotaxis protein
MPTFQVICEISDGLQAVQKAKELQFDLILLDIGLPTLNGIAAARQILRIAPESKIIFVSQESSSDVVQEALNLGARGYVVKTRVAIDLLAAMTAVLEGKQFVGRSGSNRPRSGRSMKRLNAKLALRQHEHWRSVAESSVAILALVSITAICYRLHFNLAVATLLYVIVVVLVSRAGSFVSSIVAAIVAALCLAHLAPPTFSFRVSDPLDVIAITAFLITSLIVARLMSRVRKQAEEALSSVSYRVIKAEERERQRIASNLHEDIGQRLTLLLIRIEQLKPDSLNAVGMPSRIDDLWKETLEILGDVKALAHELYSPRLEYLGIARVMSSFCKEFGDRKRVEIDFRSDDLPSFVAPNLALCLFRVLQEDRVKQDRAATSDLNWRCPVDAGDKLLHLFPRRPLRQIFVRVDAGCVDGLSNAGRAPTSIGGIAKERAQRVHMERDGSPLPPAGHGTGEVLGNRRRRHCGQWHVLCDQPA